MKGLSLGPPKHKENGKRNSRESDNGARKERPVAHPEVSVGLSVRNHWKGEWTTLGNRLRMCTISWIISRKTMGNPIEALRRTVRA